MPEMKSHAVYDNVREFRSGIFHGMGFTPDDLSRPIVGVVNCWGEINPAAQMFDKVSQAIKHGVWKAGGMPLEFCASSLCDGLSVGHAGDRFSLPWRNTYTDYIEATAEAVRFDAMVITAVCGHGSVPPALMAAARIDIPTIVFLAGCMPPSECLGDRMTQFDIAYLYGEMRSGKLTRPDYEHGIRSCTYGGGGACAWMDSGATMGILSETLGLSLPGNITVPGNGARILQMAQEAGVSVMRLWQRGLTPKQILTPAAFRNAIAVSMAIGASTAAVLHLPAIGWEADVPVTLDMFDEATDRVPFILDIKPSGSRLLWDFGPAGGVPALLKRLEPHLDTGTLSVTLSTMADNIKDARILDEELIRPLDNPIHPKGSLTILRGNLAPRGAVVKESAVASEMLCHRGPARVFDSEEGAVEAILRGAITAGDVLVIRYEGPRGGPGLRQMKFPQHHLVGSGLDKSVALITDGRMSGTIKGGAVCHVCPEAAAGGPIAIVRDGDIVAIDIPKKSVNVELPAEEIARRLSAWRPPAPKFRKGLLGWYAQAISQVDEGCVVQAPAGHRVE